MDSESFPEGTITSEAYITMSQWSIEDARKACTDWENSGEKNCLRDPLSQWAAIQDIEKCGQLFNEGEQEYDLCLMSELTADSMPKRNILYVKIESNNIVYRVITPSNEDIIGEIPLSQLTADTFTYSVTKEQLKVLLPAILKETLKRGHTREQRAVLEAISLCMLNNLPPPKWLARAFLSAYRKVTTQFQAKSLDYVFGKQLLKRTQLNAERKKRNLRFQVYHKISEIKASDPKTRIDGALFERVGEEFNIGRTLAFEFYYDVQNNYMTMPGGVIMADENSTISLDGLNKDVFVMQKTKQEQSEAYELIGYWCDNEGVVTKQQLKKAEFEHITLPELNTISNAPELIKITDTIRSEYSCSLKLLQLIKKYRTGKPLKLTDFKDISESELDTFSSDSEFMKLIEQARISLAKPLKK